MEETNTVPSVPRQNVEVVVLFELRVVDDVEVISDEVEEADEAVVVEAEEVEDDVEDDDVLLAAELDCEIEVAE